MSPANRVLVVGASGELGSALALIHARRGARLSLWGRDLDRLERVARACEDAGAASAEVRSLDLENLDAALAALELDDNVDPFGMALFAAGLGDIRGKDDLAEDPALVTRLGKVNFIAPAAISAALANRMARRGRGRIVIVGSVAGFHSLPFAAAYAGSKAGLARFAEALGIAVRPHGVAVTLVSPGFIDTAAARRVPGPKPFAMSAAAAAAKIVKAVDHGKHHIIIPWQFGLLGIVDRCLPRWLRDRLLRAAAPAD